MRSENSAATVEKADDLPPAPAPAPRRRTGSTGRAAKESAASFVNPLDKVIGFKLRRAQLVTFQEFIEHFARVKLRPAEYALISVLEQKPGLSQTHAAAMLGIKRANFVSLFDALEARGIAERHAVHGDRRARALHLTEKGRKLAAKAKRISSAYDEMLEKRLGGAKERDRFLAMLDRLIVQD